MFRKGEYCTLNTHTGAYHNNGCPVFTTAPCVVVGRNNGMYDVMTFDGAHHEVMSIMLDKAGQS
jgi:hypothetical protein